MNIKQFCIISLLVALSTNSFAQKATITFVSDKDCEAFIYEPIDIQKQVYGTDRYDIPRYVLISPTGAILHKDLPRPSDYPKLKETLDKLIKQ